MTTQVYWYCPQRIIYVQIYGVLTIEQVAEGHRHNIELMESVPHQDKIHFIFDSSNMQHGPTNFLEIRRAGREFYRHDRLGWSIGVGDSTLIRFVSSTIAQFSNINYRAFHYLEEGIQFLQETDSSLPELELNGPTGEILYTLDEGEELAG